MGFKLPIHIDMGYLNVPKFIAKEIARVCEGDIEEEDTLVIFQDSKLTEPFVEIRIINCGTMLPDVIRTLANTQIPFHYNYTFAEDMEVEYWYLLNKDNTEIEGNTSADTNRMQLEDEDVDFDYINKTVADIKAQHVMLGGDIDALLEVREIHIYDFN